MAAIAKQYLPTIKRAVRQCTAAGVPSAFALGADMAVVGGVWIYMVHSLVKLSPQKEVDEALVTKLVGASLTGAATYLGAVKVGSWFFNLIPGAGTLASIGINSSLNGLITFRFGKAVVALLEQEDFAASDLTEMTNTILLTLCAPFSLLEGGELASMFVPGRTS